VGGSLYLIQSALIRTKRASCDGDVRVASCVKVHPKATAYVGRHPPRRTVDLDHAHVVALEVELVEHRREPATAASCSFELPAKADNLRTRWAVSWSSWGTAEGRFVAMASRAARMDTSGSKVTRASLFANFM